MFFLQSKGEPFLPIKSETVQYIAQLDRNTSDTSKSNFTNLARLCPRDSNEIIFSDEHQTSWPHFDGRSVNIKRISKKNDKRIWLFAMRSGNSIIPKHSRMILLCLKDDMVTY